MALPKKQSRSPAYIANHPKWAKGHPGYIKGHPKNAAAAKTLLAKRANAKLNDPNEVIKPLTPKTLNQRADQLAGAQFDPAIRASKYLQTKQLPDWFAGFQNDLHSIEQRQAQNTATATGQIQNFANSSSAVDQTQQGQMNQEMQQSAAQRGATVDPKIALMAQQASAARRAGTDTQGALVAGQGATQGNFLLDKERIAGGDKISRQAEQGRVQQGLYTQRGAEKEKQKASLVEGERRNLLERAAFGLNQQKAADSTALAAAKIKTTAASQAATRAVTKRGQDLAHRDRERNTALAEYKVHHPKTTSGTTGAKAQAKFKQNFQNSYDKIWAHMRAFPNPNRASMLDYALSHAGSGPGAQAGARAAVNRWYTKKK